MFFGLICLPKTEIDYDSSSKKYLGKSVGCDVCFLFQVKYVAFPGLRSIQWVCEAESLAFQELLLIPCRWLCILGFRHPREIYAEDLLFVLCLVGNLD